VSGDLEPIDPETAVDLYLEHRRGEASERTLKGHKYRLEHFVEFCEKEDITNMNDVSGRDLHAFRVWRREEGDLKPISLRGQLATLRAFLRFCASIDAVPEDLRQKVLLPTVSGDEQRSETTLDYERASDILQYLDRYHYAARKHVILLTLWRTGIRMGSLRAIDLDDLDLDAPGVQLVHRPGSDTPLKNKEKAERWVALSPRIATVIRDYIDGPRIETTDEYRREPLLTTEQGRASGTVIRSAIYSMTRPCWIDGTCPHDRDPEECEANSYRHASKCPSSRSPHDVRSGAITAHLLEDVPVEIVSDRMDVSKKILDRHYDRRSEWEKMEQRRQYLPTPE